MISRMETRAASKVARRRSLLTPTSLSWPKCGYFFRSQRTFLSKTSARRGPATEGQSCFVDAANQADELPQVRDLGLHPFLLRRHEILDALLQLRLHRWLISADGKQEMVEAHVPTKCLVRCPSLTLHQEDHLGVHQLRKHVQDHRSVEAWLSRNRHLLWNLLLQRPGAESFELGFPGLFSEALQELCSCVTMSVLPPVWNV